MTGTDVTPSAPLPETASWSGMSCGVAVSVQSAGAPVAPVVPLSTTLRSVSCAGSSSLTKTHRAAWSVARVISVTTAVLPSMVHWIAVAVYPTGPVSLSE